MMAPVFATGVVVIALFLYAQFLDEQIFDRNEKLLRLSESVQHKVTEAHLWFEEELANDVSIDHERDVAKPLNDVRDLLGANLSTLESTQSGVDPSPATLRALRARVEELRGIISDRVRAGDQGSAGTNLDQRFDAVYVDILRLCSVLSSDMRSRIDADRRITEWVDSVILAIVVGLFGVLALVLWRNRRALARHNAELESRVEKRTEELQELNAELVLARDQAEAASRTKSQFLANMSHEIRTPLNGVVGMASLLLRTRLSKDQQEYAETVRSSSQTLLEIINDILDFSKIEAGKLSLEAIEFDLVHAVEEVLELHADQAHKKGLELVSFVAPDVPEIVRGDPARLKQILSNLLGNAVKFTLRGEVSVEVRCDSSDGRDGCRLRFAVTDTGIGISEEKQSLLFAPFTQADGSTTREFGGTGLGLVISKELSRLMGGTIGMESSPGEGSTFWFEVPFGLAVTASPSRRRRLPELRVLIVDTTASRRRMLKSILDTWEVVATQEESRPGAALERLRRSTESGRPFDAVLIDYELPGSDGLTFARKITKDPGIAPCAIVLLLERTRQEELKAVVEAGMAMYATKPVRRSRLFNVLAIATGNGWDVATRSAVVDPLTAPAAAAPISRGSESRVLLVEDNMVNQKVALRILRDLGYRADLVVNGRQAIEAATKHEYSAVLMDCQMPELDGYEATRRIREWEAGRRRTPIIALTAHAMEGDRQKALSAGMDGYLAKPFTVEELRDVLAVQMRPADVVRSPDGDAGEKDLDRTVLGRIKTLNGTVGDDFEKELFSLFLEDAPRYLDALQAACGAGRALEVRHAAHTLKSTSSAIGARAMAALCAEIETRASREELELAPGLISELRQRFERVRGLIHSHMEQGLN